MILLKLDGDKVMEVVFDIASSYQPKENEAVVDNIPHVSLESGEIAYMYYRNGSIVFEKENKYGSS